MDMRQRIKGRISVQTFIAGSHRALEIKVKTEQNCSHQQTNLAAGARFRERYFEEAVDYSAPANNAVAVNGEMLWNCS